MDTMLEIAQRVDAFMMERSPVPATAIRRSAEFGRRMAALGRLVLVAFFARVPAIWICV